MLGKLKVKGNIMLLQKLNSLWLELLKSGKAPEFPYIMELMAQTVGCLSRWTAYVVNSFLVPLVLYRI